jgi:hypothetical protein
MSLRAVSLLIQSIRNHQTGGTPAFSHDTLDFELIQRASDTHPQTHMT